MFLTIGKAKMPRSFTFEITQPIPSKKNAIYFAKGRAFSTTKKETDEIIKELVVQKLNKYPRVKFPLLKEITWEVQLRGPDRRDFNNELSTLGDCLQDAGIIRNDRLIKHYTICDKVVDKKSYCEIKLYEKN